MLQRSISSFFGILLKVLLVAMLFVGHLSFAQSNLLNAKKPEEIGKPMNEQLTDRNSPLPYPFINDRDVLWSKTVWEIIDLRQRANFHLYYPLDTVNIGSDRSSLYDLLTSNIKNGRIAEHVYADSYFRIKKDWESLQESLSRVDTLDMGYDQINQGAELSDEYIDRREITSSDIVQYRVKGVWYFDKKEARLMWRTIGIAPVSPDVYFINTEQKDKDLVELFWVWYPAEEVRQLLFESKVFNESNSAKSISYDLVFNTHRYQSVIYKYVNLYQDRAISDYIGNSALDRLLEGERIKEGIREFEQNLWVD